MSARPTYRIEPERVPTRKSCNGSSDHNLAGPDPRTLVAIAALAELAFGTQGL